MAEPLALQGNLPVKHPARLNTPVARAVALLLAMGSPLIPVQAQAQTAASSGSAETIVITGTLIRGTGPVGSPVAGLSRAEIEKTPAANPVELLRQLPQIANLGASDTHTTTTQNANQNVTVGSGINLRGLGPESTLVLVNGRRMAPGGVAGQYTDPSVIPNLAIERMEVLTDGASATYGSDAVGGVVNLRLRRNFTGVEGLLRYGAADGTTQKQASLIVGKHWDSGSVMAAVDTSKRTLLNADDRSFYTDDMRPWGGPDLRGFNANPANVQVGTARYGIPAAQNGVGLTTAALAANTVSAGKLNLQSIYKGISALPEQDRTSAVLSFNQDLASNVQLTLEGFYSERKFLRYVAAQSGNYTVRNTNPFFTAPTAGLTSVTVNYSFFNDLGASASTGFERAFQAAAELNVQLPGQWNATVYATHSVDQNRNLSPSINTTAVNAALADTNPATALNLFCDGTAFRCNNPATLALLPAYNDRNSKYTMDDVAVKFDGPLFALPAGQVRAAIGAEYHSDKLPYFLIVNNTTANTSLTRYTDNSGSNAERTVKSVFVETYVPLVAPKQGVPGVQQLELSLAARAEDYSDFGATRNPKLGLRWVPTTGLEVRGTYSKAFRAPTLGDLDAVNGSAVNAVDRAAPGGGTRRGILFLGGNNNGLQPERATIHTLGLSFKPAALPGLTTSIDWYDIDYRNRILTPGNDLTVLQRPELAAYVNLSPTLAQWNAALANPVYSGSQAEPYVAGTSYIIDGRRQNAGAVKIAGVDLAARYLMPSALGQWTGGLTASVVTKYRQQFTPTTPMVDGLLNTLNNPLRLRARAELGWAREGVASVTAFFNHANGYNNTTVTPVARVKALTTVDLSARLALGRLLSWQGGKGLYITAAVNNLFDKDPPFVRNGTLAFDPQNASAQGRFVSLAIGGSW